MAWKSPKVNWTAVDGVRADDMNRIEGNIHELHENVGGAKRPATVVVGNAQSGHNAEAVDYLCDGESDDIEINEAIRSIAGTVGGTILLLDGNYSLASSIELNSNNISLEGVGRSTTLYSELDTGINITSDFCCVKNLCILGDDASGRTGIRVNANRCLISDCLFNYTYTGAAVSGNYNTVRNCEFNNNRLYGISLSGNYGTVSSNMFNQVTISISTSYSTGCLITNNSIYVSTSTNSYGIAPNNSSKLIISNNNIMSVHVGIELYNNSAGNSLCTVSNNVITNCNVGISLSNTHSNVISGNLVQRASYTSAQDTLQISGSNQNVVSGNRLVGKNYYEVLSTGNVYTGNVVV